MSDQSTVIINGLHHKIGVHGKVFVWVNNHWIKSDKTRSQVEPYFDQTRQKITSTRRNFR